MSYHSYVEDFGDQSQIPEKTTRGEETAKRSQASRQEDQQSSTSSFHATLSLLNPSNETRETLFPSSSSTSSPNSLDSWFLLFQDEGHGIKTRIKRSLPSRRPKTIVYESPVSSSILTSKATAKRFSEAYAEYDEITEFKKKALEFDDVETCVKECTNVICETDDASESKSLSPTDSLEFCINKLCRQRLCSQVSSKNCYHAMSRTGNYKNITMEACIATCGCHQVYDDLSHKLTDPHFMRNGMIPVKELLQL